MLAGLLLPAIAVAQGVAPAATRSPIGTKLGWELGGQIADYKYEEPAPSVKISGMRWGAVGNYTFAYPNSEVFSRLEMRISNGLLKYESAGSGTLNDVPDWIAEARFVWGTDFFPVERWGLSPYVGLGVRYLYNDLRGTSSTGAVGYRRESNYLYLPLGATARFSLGDRWVFAPTVEWDVFLTGRQRTQLTDTGIAGLGNITNEQNSGRGYRAYFMFETSQWSIGPWLHYWKINDSDVVVIAPGLGAQEPKNTTREAGVEVRYRF